MGCFVPCVKRSMRCFVQGDRSLCDVLSVVLSDLCGMFCPWCRPGWQSLWDVLSGVSKNVMGVFLFAPNRTPLHLKASLIYLTK